MEKEATNAVEVAAQKNQKREKIEEAAQGWIKSLFLNINTFLILGIIMHQSVVIVIVPLPTQFSGKSAV